MRTIIGTVIILALYAGSLIWKNHQIEEKKRAYIPTTYDLQKKSGIPVTVDFVKKGKFQEFITISGNIVNGSLKSSVAPFVRRQIRIGETARLEINHGKVISGRVVAVSPGPSLLTGLYEVNVEFNRGLPKNLGAVTVDIPVREIGNVLLVPRTAVSNREVKPVVFVMSGNKLTKKVVEIAGSNADVFWIRSGLSIDEAVVTSDSRYFTGGELVKVTNETRKNL